MCLKQRTQDALAAVSLPIPELYRKNGCQQGVLQEGDPPTLTERLDFRKAMGLRSV